MRRSGSITVLLILLFSGTLLAQTDRPEFQFGFRLAPNLGWIKPDVEYYSSEGLKVGYSWGFVAEYNFSPTYCLTSGFSITSNFGKLKYPYVEDSLIGTLHRKYSIRSLEIPIMLKMRTKEIGDFVYFGTIGFGSSLNLKANADDVFDITDPEINQTTSEKEVKNKIRFFRESLIVGIGSEYNISGDTQVFAGILFNNGITNILKGYNTQRTDHAEKAISNYFELNVGVLF